MIKGKNTFFEKEKVSPKELK